VSIFVVEDKKGEKEKKNIFKESQPMCS